MNVQELKELLEDLPDDMEVRLMIQPSYPFEYSITGSVMKSELQDEDQAPDEFAARLWNQNVPLEEIRRRLKQEYGFGDDDCDELLPNLDDVELPDQEDCLYLLEGSQLGYGNKNAWNF